MNAVNPNIDGCAQNPILGENILSWVKTVSARLTEMHENPVLFEGGSTSEQNVLRLDQALLRTKLIILKKGYECFRIDLEGDSKRNLCEFDKKLDDLTSLEEENKGICDCYNAHSTAITELVNVKYSEANCMSQASQLVDAWEIALQGVQGSMDAIIKQHCKEFQLSW